MSTENERNDNIDRGEPGTEQRDRGSESDRIDVAEPAIGAEPARQQAVSSSGVGSGSGSDSGTTNGSDRGSSGENRGSTTSAGSGSGDSSGKPREFFGKSGKSKHRKSTRAGNSATAGRPAEAGNKGTTSETPPIDVDPNILGQVSSGKKLSQAVIEEYAGQIFGVASTVFGEHWQLSTKEKSTLAKSLQQALSTLPEGMEMPRWMQQLVSSATVAIPWISLAFTASLIIYPRVVRTNLERRLNEQRAKAGSNTGDTSSGTDGGNAESGFANSAKNVINGIFWQAASGA